MAKPVYNGPWLRLRLAVLERDGHRCQMRGPKCKGTATTVDHIVSVAQGGAWHDPSNLRAACTACNYAAGARLATRRRVVNRRTVTPRRHTEATRLTW